MTYCPPVYVADNILFRSLVQIFLFIPLMHLVLNPNVLVQAHQNEEISSCAFRLAFVVNMKNKEYAKCDKISG